MTGGAGADRVASVDLARAAGGGGALRPAWARRSADLDVNLLVLEAGQEVPEHLNAEVDVLLVGVEGEGRVEVGGEGYPLRAGHALLVPKGTRRSICGAGGRFAYLSCHRRRAGLWPGDAPRPSEGGR